MKARHPYLICRAATFALLLIIAGATSVTVAENARDARQPSLAVAAPSIDLAQASVR